MKILVTGANGFVGKHLLRALINDGLECYGTVKTNSGPDLVADDDRELLSDPNFRRELCLPNDTAVLDLLNELRPDAVVHLAAVTSIATAAADPEMTWRTNVEGVRSIYRAMQKCCPEATLLHVSTGAVYGAAKDNEQPADETRMCQPEHSYGWSKLAAEAWLAMVEKSEQDSIRTIIARPFNHVGPGQSDAFALSSFAQQIAELERSESAGPMRVLTGNLDARRDFLDVRDVVSAYLELLKTPSARGVFNVCSGQTHRIGDLLESLCAQTSVEIEITRDRARFEGRGPDSNPVTGTSERLQALTNWSPVRSLDNTLVEILDNWRRFHSVKF